MSVEFVVLAAGSATRMEGASKLSQQIGDRNIVGSVIQNLQDSGAGKITVIYGDRWGLDDLQLPKDVNALRNANSEAGMGGSIALAVANLSPDTERVLVALGDMPLVKPETLSLLILKSASGHANIWAPTFQGKRGNPVIFARCWFEKLAKLDGDQGGAMLFGNENAQVEYIEVNDSGVLLDIDTPEDLSKVLANIKPS